MAKGWSSGKIVVVVLGLSFLVFALLVLAPVLIIALYGQEIRDSVAGPPVVFEHDPTIEALVEVTHPGPGETQIAVDWNLPSREERGRCTSVGITGRLETGQGDDLEGTEYLMLWGDQFGARRFGDKYASWRIYPCEPGAARVFVRHPERGAAELGCTPEKDQDGDLKYVCKGTLDPETTLSTPPIPECPESELTPLFELMTPGTCLGLTALELTRLPVPTSHLRMRDGRDRISLGEDSYYTPEFRAEIGQPARDVQYDGYTKEAPKRLEPFLPLLEEILGPPEKSGDTSPLCVLGGLQTWEYAGEGKGHRAVLSLEMGSCDLSDLRKFELILGEKR